MKKLLALILILFAFPCFAANTAMDSFTDDSSSPTSTRYLIGYGTTTPYRWTIASILGLAGWTASPASTCVLGFNTTWGCKTTLNVQLDDSAAQFKSAEENKGTLKFDQTGITDTKTATIKVTATDNYTWTPTILGNSTWSIGTTFTNAKWCSYATATGLTCNEDAPAGSGDITKVGSCASGDCEAIGNADTSGGYLRFAEDSDNGTDYVQIKGSDDSGTNPALTISGSPANTEDFTITLGANDNIVTFSSSTGAATLNANGFVISSNGLVPDAADGAALGSAAAEWSDAYFADGAKIYMGNDQEIVMEHVADKGVIIPALFDESVEPATDNITAIQVARGFINNYGQTDDAVLTLPAAAEGLTFVAIVGTKVDKYWQFNGNGAETIYTDIGGTLSSGKNYIQCQNQNVGSRMSCATFQTGVGTYSWLCGAISGTWTTD